jgi:L-glutamine-phosphate cytidylyltransferase
VRAVILAAGRGGRLRGVTHDQPKCLARVGGATLLDRQLRALRECGVTAITVVVGHRAASLRDVCGASVDIVENAAFATTNSLYSLWLTRHQLTGGFVVFNSDVLIHPQLLRDLLTARYEDALLVAAKGDGQEYSDEEMKLRVRAGRVVDIAKTIPPDDADGENMGVAKFGAAGAALLLRELDAIVASGRVTEWLPAAFARFCRIRPLHVVESRGLPWIEIDYPEDYWRACSDVAPAIDAELQTAAGRAVRHV